MRSSSFNRLATSPTKKFFDKVKPKTPKRTRLLNKSNFDSQKDLGCYKRFYTNYIRKLHDYNKLIDQKLNSNYNSSKNLERVKIKLNKYDNLLAKQKEKSESKTKAKKSCNCSTFEENRKTSQMYRHSTPLSSQISNADFSGKFIRYSSAFKTLNRNYYSLMSSKTVT